MNNNLEAHFYFEGSLVDSANTNHLGIASGQPAYDLFRPGDSAISFNGSSSVSSISRFNNTSFRNSAISLWVITDSITIPNQSIIQGAFMGFGIFIEGQTGKVAGFFDGTSAGSLKSPGSIVDNKWHHVVFQNDSTHTHLYLDGQFVGSQPEVFVVGNGTANNKLYLGRTNLNLANFIGSVNDLRIYSRVLSVAEVHQLYSAGLIVSAFNSGNDERGGRISLYPSPAKNQLFINGEFESNSRVRIFGQNGQQVFEGYIKQELDISDLERGVYFLKVTDQSGKAETLKFIKTD